MKRALQHLIVIPMIPFMIAGVICCTIVEGFLVGYWGAGMSMKRAFQDNDHE